MREKFIKYNGKILSVAIYEVGFKIDLRIPLRVKKKIAGEGTTGTACHDSLTNTDKSTR